MSASFFFALVFLLCSDRGADCEDGVIVGRMDCAALERHVRRDMREGQRLTVLNCMPSETREATQR